jgi:hypothetical protein
VLKRGGNQEFEHIKKKTQNSVDVLRTWLDRGDSGGNRWRKKQHSVVYFWGEDVASEWQFRPLHHGNIVPKRLSPQNKIKQKKKMKKMKGTKEQKQHHLRSTNYD